MSFMIANLGEFSYIKKVHESLHLMCKFQDLIDSSPLSQIIQSIERHDNDELAKLIRNSISPQVVDSKFITFTAWNIQVAFTW
jgi:hypothetical protein